MEDKAMTAEDGGAWLEARGFERSDWSLCVWSHEGNGIRMSRNTADQKAFWLAEHGDLFGRGISPRAALNKLSRAANAEIESAQETLDAVAECMP